MAKIEYDKESLIISGKRKRAVAKAKIKSGEGRIIINKIPYINLPPLHQMAIKEVIDLTKLALDGNFKFDIIINASGGGVESQIEASRLAIAKALVRFTKSADLKKTFLIYDKNLLVADVRRKEPYKPGDSKARAKRQKSFR